MVSGIYGLGDTINYILYEFCGSIIGCNLISLALSTVEDTCA